MLEDAEWKEPQGLLLKIIMEYACHFRREKSCVGTVNGDVDQTSSRHQPSLSASHPLVLASVFGT